MFSEGDFLQPVPRDPGPDPVPADVERAEMRSILRRHTVVNDRCQSCGNPPDHTGYCWAGRVAYERLQTPWPN
ncbi:hypothetical protein ACFP2T_15325 [Plantactinospora solaniradicis]|uniref:Uncharacterized protein n=1 Tax=Plantactinospora solaniradicis TaxID=1723736 RepID=A0ABW1KB67_9ACTN